AEHAARLARETPEVRRLELSGTLLELRAWGVRDLVTFGWLDAPRAGAVAQADRLLRALGAVDADAAVTPRGRAMLRVSAPPRLARVLLAGGGSAEVALVAALAAERDILLETRAFGGGDDARWGDGTSDLLLRAALFRDAEAAGFAESACRRLGLDRGALRAVDRARRQWARARLDDTADGARDDCPVGKAILAGFPDRVCRRRTPDSPRALMVGGTG